MNRYEIDWSLYNDCSDDGDDVYIDKDGQYLKVSEVIPELEKIAKFAKTNSGCGYSCGKMIEKILNN